MRQAGRPEAEPGAAPAGRRRVGLLLLVASGILVTDIVTKLIVVAKLSGRAPVSLLGGFLKLIETRNPGAAFSIGGPSTTALFSVIAIGVAVFILRASRRIRSVPWAVTLGLLLGGATGNLVDRIFRFPGPFRGYVVDWIQLPHWPVFNVADSAIVCGGVLAVFLAMRGTSIGGPGPAGDGGEPGDDGGEPGGDGGEPGGDGGEPGDGGA